MGLSQFFRKRTNFSNKTTVTAPAIRIIYISIAKLPVAVMLLGVLGMMQFYFLRWNYTARGVATRSQLAA